MVLAGNNNVPHPRVLCHLDPLVSVKLHWIKLANEPVININRYLGSSSDPLR